MEILKKEIRIAKSNISRMATYADELKTNNEITAMELDTKLKRLNANYNQLSRCINDCCLEDDENCDDYLDEFDAYEKKYFSALAKIGDKVKDLKKIDDRVKDLERANDRLTANSRKSSKSSSPIANQRDAFRSPKEYEPSESVEKCSGHRSLYQRRNREDQPSIENQKSKNGIDGDISDGCDNNDEIFTNPNVTGGNRLIKGSITSNNFVRLPKIKIPSFSGDCSEWLTFRDLYLSLIHDNPSLTDSQKLQYLKGYFVGDAAALLKNVAITDANYIVAWEKVLSRYNNSRGLVMSLIQRYIDLPRVSPSLKNLRKLSDDSEEIIRSLENLSAYAGGLDPWIIHILVTKLDEQTKSLWAMHVSDFSEPSFRMLQKFLNSRCESVEICSTDSLKPIKRNSNCLVGVKLVCSKCSQDHALYSCPEFKALSTEQKKEIAIRNKHCFNCLGSGHSAKKCLSKRTCGVCSKRHHTFLHSDELSKSDRTINNSQSRVTVSDRKEVSLCSRSISTLCDILPTALVLVSDNYGCLQLCRLIIDTGSQISFITESCCKRLGLRRSRGNLIVNGISGVKSQITKGKASITFKSRFNSYSQRVDVFVLTKIVDSIHGYEFSSTQSQKLSEFSLADSDLKERKPVDILISASIAIDLWLPKKVEIADLGLKLKETYLGWILYGSMKGFNNFSNVAVGCVCSELEETLHQFWKMEDVPEWKTSIDDNFAEKLFSDTTYRREDGRYVVKLPFSNYPPNLGESFKRSRMKFEWLEKRFKSDEQLRAKYVEFMMNYETSGHMTELEDFSADIDRACYLPHHGILQKGVVGTKLRVVFNASESTSNGRSLNDELLKGTKLQNDIFGILLRFRTYKYVFVCDIEQMYRQIRINDDDLVYQRIVWRNHPSECLRHYSLNTITYGTKSAPYLAMRTLIRLSEDEKSNFGEIIDIFKRDTLMDDTVTGSDDIEQLKILRDDLIAFLKKGGFNLKKWSSNNLEILQDLDPESCAIATNIIINEDKSIKTLGMYWCPRQDTFKFEFHFNDDVKLTKRKFLSVAAKIYDPLGLISPVVILLKQMFQKLSRKASGIEWDDLLPEDVSSTWIKIKDQMSELSSYRIERCAKNGRIIDFHGFCDASVRSYAAVMYCRSIDENGIISVKLLMAKTKVAPIEKMSIARIELCGALLLSRVVKFCRDSIVGTDVPISCWCDSRIVLCWLASGPDRWKPFVSNRVAEILKLQPFKNWNYVQSKSNPADIPSRGMVPKDLVACEMWWHGPKFLEELKPRQENIDLKVSNVEDEERVQAISVQLESNFIMELAKRESDFQRLQRLVAYLLRFKNNCIKTVDDRSYGVLNVFELKAAVDLIVANHQRVQFKSELTSLNSHRSLSKSSKLKRIPIILDDNGIIRLNSRLQNSFLTFEEIHPFILDSSHLAELIVIYYHRRNMHSGVDLTISLIRKRFWILGLRSIVKRIIGSCINCLRYRTRVVKQSTGNLPECRTNISFPFENVGIDYAGPISVRPLKCRGNFTTKGYIAVFVCLVTKAVHLEVSMNLDTESFLAAFHRFISRRGLCRLVMTDNGRNFLGARNELYRLGALISSNEFRKKIEANAAEHRIDWKFIPAYTPHFGGLWESTVKSIKNHLKKTFLEKILTVEEFNTVLCRIESLLNSRPLIPCTEDVDNLEILTPAHFLLGRSMQTLPESKDNDDKCNLNSRYLSLSRLVNVFWSKWKSDYLNSLKAKFKSPGESIVLGEGDLVLVRKKVLNNSDWPLGRVVKLYPGSDGQTRVVDIDYKGRVSRESVVNIIPLKISKKQLSPGEVNVMESGDCSLPPET